MGQLAQVLLVLVPELVLALAVDRSDDRCRCKR
jgi:hypothetical protein